MKRRLLTISILLVLSLTMVFASCASSAEKEANYYEELNANLKEVGSVLDTLGSSFDDNAFTSEFSMTHTFYDGVVRGSFDDAGWKKGQKVTGSEEEYDWRVNLVDYSIALIDSDNYYIKSTVYKLMTKDFYDKYKTKKNYGGKFEVDYVSIVIVENGVETNYLNGTQTIIPQVLCYAPFVYIDEYSDKEYTTTYGISAQNGFKLYTNLLRVASRRVYDKDDNIIDKATNDACATNFSGITTVNKNSDGTYTQLKTLDANDYKYWENYGEDISFNWDKVYGIKQDRVTVSYSKEKIKTYEFYQENIISYYTKKDNVNKYNVLKADVVDYVEMVMEFNYPKKGENVTLPTV